MDDDGGDGGEVVVVFHCRAGMPDRKSDADEETDLSEYVFVLFA